MNNNDIKIDIEKLRKDLRGDLLGAYFGGGFGAALIEAFDVDSASPEELIEMAKRQGLNLNNYIII